MAAYQNKTRNKTLGTLLAFVFGAVGAHRFYLGGRRDRWAWLHLACLPAAALVVLLAPGADPFFKMLPVVLSALAGCLAALVLGLTPDDQWDRRYNAGSGRQTASRWPLAVLLVLTLAIGAGVLIATLARLFDLLYTGGAYG